MINWMHIIPMEAGASNYGPQKSQNHRTIESCDNMCIVEVVYTILIYLLYTLWDHLSITNNTLMYVFNAILIMTRFIVHPIALYCQWVDGTIGHVKTYIRIR